MALNAKTDPTYLPKRINGKFARGYSGHPGGSPARARERLNVETTMVRRGWKLDCSSLIAVLLVLI